MRASLHGAMSTTGFFLPRSHMGSATDLRFPLSAVVHAPAEPFGTAPGLPRAQKGRFAARREETAKVTNFMPAWGQSWGWGLLPCMLVSCVLDLRT